jgi:hypothetical protein
MRYLLIFCLALLGSFSTSATHLMGGSFRYTHLGNGLFDIKLTLHIDHVNGNPAAVDPTVWVGFYDAANNTLIDTIRFVMAYDTIGTCQAACGYCVRSITYTHSPVPLSIPAAGVLLTHDRCCKSNVISNVLQPLSTGTLTTALIPAVPNNSPVFNTFTPPVIFTNQLNAFDASATDADGDELRYRLDDLYQGSASTTDPAPAPGALTISALPWQQPYSKLDMLGGPQPLQIDSVTGQMTANPATQGFFQIAYRVEEYRNGQLIGYIRNEVQVFVCASTLSCLVFPMGNAEAVKAGLLQLRPNPFSSQVQLMLPEGSASANEVLLFDHTGRQVLRLNGPVLNGPLQVPVSLPSGLYLLQVATTKGTFSARVVKE